MVVKSFSRRNFLGGASSLIGGAFSASMFPGLARADLECSQPFPFNGGLVRECVAGFRIPRFTARQECDQWCWAACIEAAFNLYDYRVDQRRIVEKLYGPAAPCLPAIGPGIANAVSGEWESDDGDYFYADLRVHTDVTFGIADPFALGNASRYLADGVPVIVGALGHATLLTAMKWAEDNFGQQRLLEMIVRDPWPGNRNRRLLSPQEFYGTSYIAAVFVD